MKKSKYKELNDGEWLKQKYIKETLSTIEMGKIVGCDPAVICKALRRFNIPVRSKSWGHRIKRNDYLKLNLPVIEGSLLGDCSISLPNHGTGNSIINKTNINYDHTLYFAQQIFEKEAEKRVFGPKESTSSYDNCKPFYQVLSYAHPELKELRNKWYPQGKKIIPRDIVLSKESLLHWFMDDGYSYYVIRFKGQKYEQKIVRVQFATQSFTKNDLDFLCQKIFDLFRIKMTPRLHRKHGKIKGTGYFMEVSEHQIKDFFTLIGPCPVDSLKYKWKLV